MRNRWFASLLTSALVCGVPAASCNATRLTGGAEGGETARHEMVESQLAARDIRDVRVLDAMRLVPRHLFVPPELRRLAYRDSPLPIGLGQTISQPYIVALMTQLAEPKADDRVLEVGTGSGYQAAVLSRLTRHVYTIEIIPELAQRARETVAGLGYENVTVRAGDGYEGWVDRAPFDIIVVTAAAPHLPQPLREQLAEGGRLVVPVGQPGRDQMLVRYRKRNGYLERENVLPVIFVPMTGKVAIEK